MTKKINVAASLVSCFWGCLLWILSVGSAPVVAEDVVPEMESKEIKSAPLFAETWRADGTLAAKAVQPRVLPKTQPKGRSGQSMIPEAEMFVGETRVFPAPSVARIAVGNGQIMSAASLDDKEVIVFANATGTSSLFIWNKNGTYQRIKINIVAGDTSRIAREMAAFLSTIPNARASVIGDKVIVEGDDLSDQDLAKIDELAKRYPQVVNFTNSLGWEQMVLMDVKVVEFPRNELREIGLKWNPTGGAAVGGVWMPGRRGSSASEYLISPSTEQGNLPPISSAIGDVLPQPRGLNVLSIINMGINAQLALLAKDGKAAILAEPRLSARNGSKATFLAGGEYPYTVSTINGPTVMFKPYGVKLEIAPRVSRQGVIRATIDSEVSAIDDSMATAAGPGLSSRRTTTEFNVREGETLVLAGLLTRKNSESIDKVPFLGDLPVLGALFRSKRFQNDETELVVFVTPHIVDSRSPGLVDQVAETTRRLEENLGKPAYLSAPNGLQPGAKSDVEFPVEAASAGTVSAESSTDEAVLASNAEPRVNQRVNREGIVVYAMPNRLSDVLARPSAGTVLAAASGEAVGGWRQVLLPGGKTGWVVERMLSPTTDALSSEVYDEEVAASGTGKPLTGQSAAWPVTAQADAGGAPGAWYRVVTQRLALRVGPDMNAQRIAWLPKGNEIEALSTASVDGWLAVRAGQRKGWVWAQLLEPIHAEEP